jgi:Peptidase family M23
MRFLTKYSPCITMQMSIEQPGQTTARRHKSTEPMRRETRMKATKSMVGVRRRLAIAVPILLALPFASAVATAPAASATPQSSPELLPFIGSYRISATWGTPSGGYHAATDEAIDFELPEGTAVYSTGAGRVDIASVDNRNCNPDVVAVQRGLSFNAAVGWCISQGYPGTRVRIVHPDGRTSLYLHLSSIAPGISATSTVAAGQLIAYSGNTGISSGAHLHYQEGIVGGDSSVDPGTFTACQSGTTITYTDNINRKWQTLRNDNYNCAATGVPDGGLVRVAATGNVYRIAGGSPLWLGKCPPEGCGAATPIDQATIDGMSPVPANGTLIQAFDTGKVYTVAGGAPLWLGKCPPSGCIGMAVVDQSVIDRLDHLRARPSNGTLIQAFDTGRVYTVAGGAPLWLGACPPGGCVGLVLVDQSVIDRLEHLSPVPADRTLVQAFNKDGRVYQVLGGVARWISKCPPEGCGGVIAVDQSVIDRNEHLYGNVQTPVVPASRVGGIDFQSACVSQNGPSTAVVVAPSDAFSWRCQAGTRLLAVDLARACQATYGSASWLGTTDKRSASGWNCYR